jgi:hypothetical protein
MPHLRHVQDGRTASAKDLLQGLRADPDEARAWVPVELGRAVYTKGYNSGHAMGKRTGFAKGYEQALKDMGVGTEMRLEEYRRQRTA